MRFNVATVQSAAPNACNQVWVQPDFQAMVGMMVTDAEMVPTRLRDADWSVYFQLFASRLVSSPAGE